MDDAAVFQPDPAAATTPCDDCTALADGSFTAFARLEAVVGSELAHRLVAALVSSR
jgi:hypothetical protein